MPLFYKCSLIKKYAILIQPIIPIVTIKINSPIESFLNPNLLAR